LSLPAAVKLYRRQDNHASPTHPPINPTFTRTITMYKPFRDCQETIVTARAGPVQLAGRLIVPHDAETLILCIHNSGQWQRNPRNHYFTHLLRQAGCATLLLDLLTPQEEDYDVRMGRMRFNTDLLASRLVLAIDWARECAATRWLRLGLFGSGNAANTVLLAASERSDAIVGAVACNGPLLSLIALALRHVQVPTLLIAGGDNRAAVDLHRVTLAQLGGPKQLVVLPGVMRPFEESGAIEEVARLSHQWFQRLEHPEQPVARTFSMA
jgi:putative phosphoribosyl transferase